MRTSSRPHFVLFIADDLSWHDVGPYGSIDIQTPHLDRLAREGMTFKHAFCASPTCTPSRSAIYTGLYPFRNGAHANHSLIQDGVRTLPQYLRELGYRVVIAGKTHIGPRSSFPFEYLADSNVMTPGKHEVLDTDLNTAAVGRLLATHDRRQPLCLVVGSHSPHVYWPKNERFDSSKITLPPFLLDTPETREMRCEYYTDVESMDRQVGEVLSALEKHGFADDTFFAFTADHGAQWPFAKWTLYDAGIRVPLIVRWPGKAKANLKTRALASLIDLLPTMMEAAVGESPKEMDGRSFLPVLLGQTEQHRNEVFATHTGDGQMNRTPMRCVRTGRFKYIINLAPQVRFTTHISDAGPRDGKLYWDSWEKLTASDAQAAAVVRRYRERPAEELYDVLDDPYELKNLASDPEYAKPQAELRKHLAQWRIEQGEDLNRVPTSEDARRGEIYYAS